MHSVDRSQDLLVLSVEETGFSRFLFVLAAAAAAWATYQAVRFNGFLGREQFQGSVAGVFLFGLSALAVWERARFAFDLKNRELRWSRARLWKTVGGTVPFASIRYVGAEISMSSKRIPMRRVIVETEASIIPVTVGYAADAPGERSTIAAGVREFVGILERPADLSRLLS